MPKLQRESKILLDSGTNEVEFLIITLGTQRYGINVSKVCTIQVFEPSRLSPMPHQRDEVLGIMPFRDKTISLVDLSLSLRSSAVDSSSARRLLIVSEFNQRTTGFVVDGVEGIERFDWAQFEPITGTTCNGDETSILGTVRTREGLVLVIDLETIMTTLDPTMNIEHYAPMIVEETNSRSKVKVLHLDDSPLIQKIVGEVLRKAGFETVLQVSNGEDGIQYITKNGASSVDIVITDIEMPKMDGLTFCKKVRTDMNLTDVPILFFSSLITDQMLQKCKTVGGDGAYSKPQINMIVGEIDRLLATKQRTA